MKQQGFNPLFFLAKLLLYPFALLYGVVIWLRNRLYDSGFFSSVRFDRPVICIGNLSVGGTGKTPHVEYLIELLQYRYRVATMSRGYKRRTQGFLIADENANALKIGDEPMQYYLKYPDIAVSVAEERMTGIPDLLLRRPDTDVLLLDDAFQHRSVRAHINILITDYARPFYKDHILPYGGLRESRIAYKRADIIMVSKCPEHFSEEDARGMVRHIKPLPQQQVFFSGLRYKQAYDFFTGAAGSLEGRNIIIVCGIARPETLVRYVSKAARAVHAITYPDHHYFLSRDLEEIRTAYDNWQADNKIVLTTEKDAARFHLQKDRLTEMGLPLYVLPVEVEILFNRGTEFDRLIQESVESIRAADQTEPFPPHNL